MQRVEWLIAVALIFLWLGPAHATVSRNAIACKLIHNATELQAMQNNLAGVYCLAKNIDTGEITNFAPIGDATNKFTGSLYGNNHVVRNLTISSSAAYVGLFGFTDHAVIQDLSLIDVNIVGTADDAKVGGLVGQASATSGSSTIARVLITGRLSCTAHVACTIGGFAGQVVDQTSLMSLRSTARIIGGNAGTTGGAVGVLLSPARLSQVFTGGDVSCTCGGAGGLAGESHGSIISSYATGAVSGRGFVGGAVGVVAFGGTVQNSFATGPVSNDSNARIGGLIGEVIDSVVTQSYAAGPVSGGVGADVGGLIGFVFSDSGKSSSITESYAVGAVSAPAGSTLGGLLGAKDGTGTLTYDFAYWDLDTTGQFSSAAGTARSTADMRSTVPCCLPGHSNPWAITKNLSYPFLNDADITFTSPLATLVRSSNVFVFLPISQLDKAQYKTAPARANAASLAAVYTMIARAIGITENVAELKNVKIDRYFWDDATQTTTWRDCLIHSDCSDSGGGVMRGGGHRGLSCSFSEMSR